jgi:hypothetical protein
MIDRDLFERIRTSNGAFASWAVWEPEGARPKSNMGPHRIFDVETNSSLLATLRVDVVMVGLNFSRELVSPKPFANFHDESPYANDFKIRYAFRDTPYYGAYMTDVLKNLVIPDAQKVRDLLRIDPDIPRPHIQRFEKELQLIESHRPLILAFGRDAFSILHKYLNRNAYSQLIQTTHYSHQIRKEKYRLEVLGQIESALRGNTAI